MEKPVPQSNWEDDLAPAIRDTTFSTTGEDAYHAATVFMQQMNQRASDAGDIEKEAKYSEMIQYLMHPKIREGVQDGSLTLQDIMDQSEQSWESRDDKTKRAYIDALAKIKGKDYHA